MCCSVSAFFSQGPLSRKYVHAYKRGRPYFKKQGRKYAYILLELLRGQNDFKKKRRGDKELFENRGLWRAITFETSLFYKDYSPYQLSAVGTEGYALYTMKTGGDFISDSSKTHFQTIFDIFWTLIKLSWPHLTIMGSS